MAKTYHRQWLKTKLVLMPQTSRTFALADTNTWLAFCVIFPEVMASGYLGPVRTYFSAVTGSPTVTVSLYTVTAGTGYPGTLVEASAATSVTGAGYFDFTGFTATSAITANTPYWLIFKNTAGSTSATVNYFNGDGYASGSNALPGSIGNTITCTDGGAGTWTFGNQTCSGFRFSLTDGTDTYYYGANLQSTAGVTLGSDRIYGTQERGLAFTAPPGGFYLAGGSIYARKSGSPTGLLGLKLYEGTTLVRSASIYDPAFVSSANFFFYDMYFTSSYYCKGDTVYRLVGYDSAADSSSNYYYFVFGLMDTDADSLPLLPFNQMYTKMDSGTPTDDNTHWLPFAIILDSSRIAQAAGVSVGDNYMWE